MRHEDALSNALPGGERAENFAGTWTNAHGSSLQLRQAAAGKLSGSCFGASSGGTFSGEIQGYADGELIAVVVQWRAHRAVTAWAGHLEPGANPPRMIGAWQMAKRLPADGEGLAIHAGSDSFIKTGDSTPGLARREPV
jgi:hypothetical protein